MKVLRDVVIDSQAQDELLAVSHVPGITGERMSLDLLGGGSTLGLTVKVLESRPVIVDGAVRHRMRLAIVPPLSHTGDVDGESAGNAATAAEAN